MTLMRYENDEKLKILGFCVIKYKPTVQKKLNNQSVRAQEMNTNFY